MEYNARGTEDGAVYCLCSICSRRFDIIKIRKASKEGPRDSDSRGEKRRIWVERGRRRNLDGAKELKGKTTKRNPKPEINHLIPRKEI